MFAPSPTSLRRSDYLLLVCYCAVLFSLPLLLPRSMNIHETVHCVNIQEMLRDGDWVIPHYGGRPWLERPPLPFWLTIPFVRVLGDHTFAYRLAPALMALCSVLLAGWIGSRLFGRTTGVLAGLALATMHEFNRYTVAPECDMFLCALVMAVHALFVHLEFGLRPAAPGETPGFLGRRPWPVFALFVLLGLTNLVKGISFGTVMALLPIACYLLLGPHPWTLIRRYVWLPGWLAFAAVGSAWAVAVYLRQPDFVELWRSDFVGRVREGYLREPVWYYLANLPLILFPWGIAAAIGMAATWPNVLRQGRTPERLLWLWALAPAVLLSVPQGKHHHYLLHNLTPWAILAAVGMVRVWETLPRVEWLRRPWLALAVLSLLGDAGLWAASRFAPGLAPHLPVLLVLLPALVVTMWWVCVQANVRLAGSVLFVLMVPVCWAGHAVNELMGDRYAGDRAFVERVRQTVPEGCPLLVHNYRAPLDASWMLYYLEARGQLLHNLTFLKAQELPDGDLYLIVREEVVPQLPPYGSARVLFASERSRDEKYPGDRFALVRMRRFAELPRASARVSFSALQATGRALGPDLP